MICLFNLLIKRLFLTTKSIKFVVLYKYKYLKVFAKSFIYFDIPIYVVLKKDAYLLDKHLILC